MFLERFGICGSSWIVILKMLSLSCCLFVDVCIVWMWLSRILAQNWIKNSKQVAGEVEKQWARIICTQAWPKTPQNAWWWGTFYISQSILAIHLVSVDFNAIAFKLQIDYPQLFERACKAFLHQRVFDPTQKKLVHLTPISPEELERFDNLDFLGP